MAGHEFSDGGEADEGIVEELLSFTVGSRVCFGLQGVSSAWEAGLRNMSMSGMRFAGAVAASRVWKASALD